tara:strand:+ start:225 stop:563 length:339 start_codon:yes stop_codon:yes gene_type:complete
MNEEFFKAVAEFSPVVEIKTEYRLYYELDTGVPISLSVNNNDGDYIVISKEQYSSLILSRIRIKDTVIKEIDFQHRHVLKLKLDSNGEFCTIKGDMMIVAATGDNYTIKKHE